MSVGIATVAVAPVTPDVVPLAAVGRYSLQADTPSASPPASITKRNRRSMVSAPTSVSRGDNGQRRAAEAWGTLRRGVANRRERVAQKKKTTFSYRNSQMP